MKLLYTLTAYPPFIGGSQIHQHKLAKELASEHSLQVICHWNQHRTDWLMGTTLLQPKSCDYSYEGISVHQLGFSRQEKALMAACLPFYYPFMNFAVQPIAKVLAHYIDPFAQKADLIHNVRIGREGLTYATHQLARRYSIPFVLTPVHHPRWQGWRYRVYTELYRQADALIVLTSVERQILIDLGVTPDRIHITGIGPILAESSDAGKFREKYQISGPMVLFLGQHYAYKGFRQVLESAPLVWQRFPEVEFVFIGPAVRQSEQAFSAFQDRRIHRLGTVDLQGKTDALAACDLLCVPSMQESFGGVFTEAWAFKKPVIGGRIPAVAEVISQGKDGLLVNQTPAEIANAIISLLDRPDLANTMGGNGYRKVQEQYSWPKLAAKTLGIYQTLCQG